MVGQTISHYKVLEKIGQGGMGEFYRADTNLSCEVAIKVSDGRGEKIPSLKIPSPRVSLFDADYNAVFWD